jgi:hypothetical protein
VSPAPPGRVPAPKFRKTHLCGPAVPTRSGSLRVCFLHFRPIPPLSRDERRALSLAPFLISNFHFLVRQGRNELAGREGVQRAKPPGQFASRQLALAEERTKKIVGAAGTFLRVAFPAAGDEVYES